MKKMEKLLKKLQQGKARPYKVAFNVYNIEKEYLAGIFDRNIRKGSFGKCDLFFRDGEMHKKKRYIRYNKSNTIVQRGYRYCYYSVNDVQLFFYEVVLI
jgi:hypothetical protein